MTKKHNKEKIFGFFGLLLVSFVGGALMPAVIRIGTQNFSPFLFNFLRSVFTLLIMSPILFKHKKYFLKKDIWKLMGALGLGIGGNILFFSLGVNQTTLVSSQLLYATVPIFVPIFAFFAINEKFNKNKFWGTLISLSGLVMLIIFSSTPEQRLALGSLKGNVLILLASLSYSTYIVSSKRFVKEYPASFVAAATYLSLTFFFLPFALFNIFLGSGFDGVNLVSWWSVFAIAILSAIFIFALQFGTKIFSAATVSMTNLLMPVFAAMMGVAFFGEKLSLVLILSLVLVTVGILLSVFSKSKIQINDEIIKITE